ncbi:hypothetical protein [Aeromonas dhakensis]|uniref:hypothetical protein n=1 Tax=Aeromonas dhakensis TaxID=196024 RepID=UPI001115F5C5|nr:hypothetical protein [Aeromonas dhakensis]
MKRTKQEYNLELDPNACYKMEAIHNRSKENFESINGWLYLGANVEDSTFAKVGFTMGDLTTRSSSAASPKYYIFCAFKCRSNIKEEELKNIEKSAFKYLDGIFINHAGVTRRALHTESGQISECYYDIDFMRFFKELHYYLYKNHCSDFIISGFGNSSDSIDGDFLDCEFNKRFSRDDINMYIREILQY